MMKINLKPLLFAGLVLVAVSPAQAEVGTAAQRSACMGDALKLCASEIPNTTRVIACLERNKEQVSPKCRAHRPGGRG